MHLVGPLPRGWHKRVLGVIWCDIHDAYHYPPECRNCPAKCEDGASAYCHYDCGALICPAGDELQAHLVWGAKPCPDYCDAHDGPTYTCGPCERYVEYSRRRGYE